MIHLRCKSLRTSRETLQIDSFFGVFDLWVVEIVDFLGLGKMGLGREDLGWKLRLGLGNRQGMVNSLII